MCPSPLQAYIRIMRIYANKQNGRQQKALRLISALRSYYPSMGPFCLAGLQTLHDPYPFGWAEAKIVACLLSLGACARRCGTFRLCPLCRNCPHIGARGYKPRWAH